jgi:lipopolysaccharide transport system ATP-binding protein
MTMAPKSAKQEIDNHRVEDRPAVVVAGLTKEFAIPHERRTTLFENVKGIFTPNTYEKFTALKNVTFTVNRGDSLGIIGENGSGKSTLLKIIANILRPTSGRVTVAGKITPFLELGVGFQPDMTVRENIEIYSTIMGLSNKEISKNIGSVLEFAGLARFEDAKLKNLSSGMTVRLAFATAIQSKPDILIVDEVLAVGDIEFQQKCYDTFDRYRAEGITIIFVSHDLNAIGRFCNKALLLKHGNMIACGNVNDVIDNYVYGAGSGDVDQVGAVPGQTAGRKTGAGDSPGEKWALRCNRKVEITGVKAFDKFGNSNSNFISADPMTIRVDFEAKEEVGDLVFGLAIYNESGIHCYGTTTAFKGCPIPHISGRHQIDFIVERLPMLEGRYNVTVSAASSANVACDRRDHIFSFVVHNNTQDLGLFNVPCRWELR